MTLHISSILAIAATLFLGHPAFGQPQEFDLTDFGIQPNQDYSIEDFRGVLNSIQSSQLPPHEMDLASSTLIDRLVQDHPKYSTIFDSDSVSANLFIRPNTLFSYDMIEEGLAAGDYEIQWEAGFTHFKSIETSPDAALDLIIRTQDSGDSFDADIVGSTLWDQRGFFTNINPDSLPSPIQLQFETIAQLNRDDVGLVALPDASFFASFSAQSSSNYPWYGDSDLEAYTQASSLNEIDIELGDSAIRAGDFTVSTTSSGLVTISGDTEDGLGRLQLSSDLNGQFGGMLVHDNQQWIITPLTEQVGGSIYSFVPIGTGATGNGRFIESLEGEPEVPQGNFGADEEDRSSEFITLAPKEIITVAFVYSEAASTYLEEIGVPALIDRFGFSELVRVNGLGGSSSVEFQSVGHKKSNFDGGRNYGQMLTEVTSGMSAEAVSIRTYRDAVSADIMVLATFRDEPSFEWYCGRVAEIAAGSEDAYLVWNINPNCIFRNSLAHEIGHIFGAVHENHSKVPIRPYAYGFTVEADGQQCSTAMSNTCTRCDRSGWSSPISKFFHPPHCHGEPMGTREKHDVARLLSEFAPIVSKFRD